MNKKCTKCDYEWESRKEEPVCCPRCKRYDFEVTGRPDGRPKKVINK